MHNLLLGTANNVTRIWCETGLISRTYFEKIQNTVNSINVPVDVGRIPSKIALSYSGFTADQRRNWTCIFSSVALKGIIPANHLRCWLLFVKATSILCTRILRVEDLKTADNYLVLFCKEFERLYGARNCTPNMHLHSHLLDYILDYGPVWCFAFERYNGMLESYPTNSKQIEPQIMRKFRQQQVHSIPIPQECYFLSHASMIDTRWTGSLLQSVTVSTSNVTQLRSFDQCEIGTCDYFKSLNTVILT